MQQPITIPLAGIKRMAVMAMLHVALVVVVYSGAQFVTTTVTDGISKTSNRLEDALANLDKRYTPRIEALLNRPADLGATHLLEPVPYLTDVLRVVRDTADEHFYRLTLEGLNLDAVQSMRVGSTPFSIATTSATERGVWRRNVDRQGHVESEALDYLAESEPAELTAIPLQIAFVTTRGTVVSFQRFPQADVNVKPLLGSEIRALHPSASPGASPEASTSPGPVGVPSGPVTVASASPAGPIPGKAEFEDYVNASTWMDAEVGLRKKLLARIGDDDLGDAHLRSIVDAAVRVPGKTDAGRAALLVEVLTKRYLVSLRLITVDHAALGAAMRTIRFPRVAQIIRAAATVDAGLHDVVQEAQGGSGKWTVMATASPGTPATPPSAENLGASLSAGDYEELQRKERTYQTCMDLVDVLTKAEQSYGSNFMAKPEKLDTAALRDQGLLTFEPSCPTGGRYLLKRWLPSGEPEIVCSIHGSRLTPGEDHRQYRIHFDAVDEARRMGLERGRVRNAITQLLHYLDDEPSNTYARVLLGELFYVNEDYERATNTLKAFSDRHPGSVKLAFMCGHGFYARGNDILADQYLQRVVQTRGDAFDPTYFEGTKSIDLYKLRDRAAGMLRGLKDKVRYGDFVIRAQVSPPSEACFNHVAALFGALPSLLAAIRAKPSIEKLYTALDQTRAQLARTPTNAKEERERLKARLGTTAATLQGFLKGVLASTADKLPAVSEGCPDGGIYFVNDKLNLDCTEHPGILSEARLQSGGGSGIASWERSALSSVVLLFLRAKDPVLDACLSAQQKILEEHFLAASEDAAIFKVPADTNLNAMVKSGAIESGWVDHAPSAKLMVVVEGSERILECTRHPSFQRILRILPEMEARQ